MSLWRIQLSNLFPLCLNIGLCNFNNKSYLMMESILNGLLRRDLFCRISNQKHRKTLTNVIRCQTDTDQRCHKTCLLNGILNTAASIFHWCPVCSFSNPWQREWMSTHSEWPWLRLPWQTAASQGPRKCQNDTICTPKHGLYTDQWKRKGTCACTCRPARAWQEWVFEESLPKRTTRHYRHAIIGVNLF